MSETQWTTYGCKNIERATQAPRTFTESDMRGAVAKARLEEAEWWYQYAHWFPNKKPAPACEKRIADIRSGKETL